MAKILLDSCVWGGAIAALQQLGHDAEWAGNWSPDPGDAEILQRAHTERRILVTLDKDFGELAIVKGAPHCGIIRIQGVPVKQVAVLLDHLVRTYADELAASAILTSTPSRLRIRLQ